MTSPLVTGPETAGRTAGGALGPFAYRSLQPPLTRAAVVHLGGALVVHLAPTLQEQAGGRWLARLPRQRTRETPQAVHERIRRWWRIDRLVDEWLRLPALAPRLLLGVIGPDGGLLVHGSLELNPSGWTATAAARRPYGLYELPTVGDPTRVTDAMLDHRGLRGYRLAAGQFGATGRDGGRSFAASLRHAVDVVR